MKRIVGWKVLFFLVFKGVYSQGLTPLQLDALLVEKTRFSVSKKVWALDKHLLVFAEMGVDQTFGGRFSCDNKSLMASVDLNDSQLLLDARYEHEVKDVDLSIRSRLTKGVDLSRIESVLRLRKDDVSLKL